MPHRYTLAGMAAAIRDRRLSPLELVDAHLGRIARENPRINAFVRILADEARDQARRGTPAGPLAGVPVTVKDSFDMEGLATACGSRLRLNEIAGRDSTAVARLKAAGAIILGKTNCPELLWNYETDNHLTGRTNNPFDVTRTAGGSSGGEAAAIASFCSAGGIGSDGGGSVRVPAHFCGIAGLKPTPGRISGAGHYPSVGYPGGLLGVAGPMARTAQDVRLLFETLAGPDDRDPFSAPVPLRRPEVKGMRIGVMPGFYSVPVQKPVAEAVDLAAAALRGAGFRVEPFAPRGAERAPNLWWFFFGELPAPFVEELLGEYRAEAHWTVTEFLARALERKPITGREVVEKFAARDAMRARFLAQMAEYPVLLAPVCGITAFDHRQRKYAAQGKEISQFEAMMPATLVNLLGLPAIAVPAALTAESLPAGVQLIGRPWEEEILLEVAEMLEREFARDPARSATDFLKKQA